MQIHCVGFRTRADSMRHSGISRPQRLRERLGLEGTTVSADREFTRIFGMPYVPGIAEVWLRRAAVEAADDSIPLLDPQSAAQISRPPAGMLVLEGAPSSHPVIRLRGLGVPTAFVDVAQAARLLPGVRLS